MRLTNARFFRFAVRLPEKGDVAGMQKLLDAHPDHREELLNGVRAGADGYSYGALLYATWLADFDEHASAHDVVTWLLEQGAQHTVWTHLHRKDRAAFEAALDADPALVDATHPMWGSPMFENLPDDDWRRMLIARGADVSDVFSAVSLGDLDRARAMIDADPSLLASPAAGGESLLLHALIAAQDDFALELLDRGADPWFTMENGTTPLVMAVVWGNRRTLARLIAEGADVKARPWNKSLAAVLVDASSPDPEVLRMLLAAGTDPAPDRFDVGDIVARAEQRGFPELARMLREHLGREPT